MVQQQKLFCYPLQAGSHLLDKEGSLLNGSYGYHFGLSPTSLWTDNPQAVDERDAQIPSKVLARERLDDCCLDPRNHLTLVWPL